MDKLEYKGYYGTVEYNREDNCLYGKVTGMDRNCRITYEGETVAELVDDFKAGVDHYLDYCEREGVKPCKSYSGVLNIRIPAEIHGRVAMIAENAGTTVNAFIRELIEKRLESIH
jgi:predicted HicB family RNase H-like nuclease